MQLVRGTDLELNFQGAILRILQPAGETFPGVSFWVAVCCFVLTAMVCGWFGFGRQSNGIMSKRPDFSLCGLTQRPCSLSLGRAHRSTVLAANSPLKSVKLANDEWKLGR